MLKLHLISLVLLIISCGEVENRDSIDPGSNKSSEVKDNSKALKLLSKVYLAHGGEKYNTAHFEFIFRDKKYIFKNDHSDFVYTIRYVVDNSEVVRELRNSELTATINNEVQNLSEKEIRGYSNGLNSVIYFATLPHKLLDPAVVLSHAGKSTVKGIEYEMLSVQFKKEGGGEDFEDEYMYWINAETDQIDYLAYNYKVNRGGVRFRSAFNKRQVGGLVFQDYINYKGEIGTQLSELSQLYEDNKLEKLSEILTENVVSLSQ